MLVFLEWEESLGVPVSATEGKSIGNLLKINAKPIESPYDVNLFKANRKSIANQLKIDFASRFPPRQIEA